MTQETLFDKLTSFDNLFLAYRKARKGKTKRRYVIEFEKNLEKNLLDLQFELKTQTYQPKSLKTFILRDPKTRKISKSSFRDRIVHHALINIIGPIFEKSFIYDSCANQKGKGNLFAIKRFDKFIKQVSKNNYNPCFILKADIKHYFQEINHEILLKIIKRKIKDKSVLWLIRLIIRNTQDLTDKGMPLGNLTSQFFANVYLNDLDYFIKNILKIKFYIRYVDDFVILDNSTEQLEIGGGAIDRFLHINLGIELHKQKTRIIPLSRGIDFVGFRNFYHYRLLRKRNIKKFLGKINLYKNNKLTFTQIFDSYIGWKGHAQCANTYKLRKKVKSKISEILWNKL